MRPLFYIFIPCILLSACCGKKKCIEHDSVEVSFYGFNVTDVDTVYATGYVRGSNFTQIAKERTTDTVFDEDAQDSVYVLRPKDWQRYKDAYDWEFYVPGTGQTYRVTDYSYSTYSCNCASDKVKTLSGCRVNGKDYNRDIKIIK
jgi:hypothetical protein